MDGPIDRNWRTLVLSFGVWILHFGASYAGELIFPGQPAARWITAGTTLVALGVLAWLWFRKRHRSTTAALAIALAAAGVIYDGLPPLLVW